MAKENPRITAAIDELKAYFMAEMELEKLYKLQYSTETLADRQARMKHRDEWIGEGIDLSDEEDEEGNMCKLGDKCWYKHNPAEYGYIQNYKLRGTELYLCDKCKKTYKGTDTMKALVEASLTPTIVSNANVATPQAPRSRSTSPKHT